MNALHASRQDAIKAHAPALQAVPDPDTAEFEQFIADILDDEHVPEWQPLALNDDTLLALDIPVAYPYGDEVPEIIDEAADVHEQTVVSIEAARVRRNLRQLPALERRVLTLRYGLDGGGPRTYADIAERVGLSRQHVPRVEAHGLRLVRERFGTALEDAA